MYSPHQQQQARAQLARDAAAHGDLILFVTDSDLNQTEYESLKQLVETNRPVIVVLNKRDLYSEDELDQLISGIRDERFADALPEEDLVVTAADPKKIEYVIEEEGGSTRTEMRSPGPDTEALRARVMEVLGRDGKSLLALNAVLFASDKSDKKPTGVKSQQSRSLREGVFSSKERRVGSRRASAICLMLPATAP